MVNTQEPGVTRTQAANIVGVKTPKRKELFILKVLLIAGLISLVVFARWLLQEEHSGYFPLYFLLLLSLGYKMLRVLHEWYHYWGLKITPRPQPTRIWTVDMLTTAVPGEPFEMIKQTLEAMKAVRYPHTTYLCDEGNDPALIALCQELDVVHVTRTVKVNAKAGNINNALQQATGELCVIMDPDHIPVPSYLDEVVAYFEDPQVGYVQMVQAYYNAEESFFARGAAQQTYLFYGPMMMGMNGYGTVQAIGANCTFRRAALDSIGGHAPGLSEDMHTAMQLHAKGWKSVYTPKILTRGLVPNTLASYFKQQIKWSRGTFDLLAHVYPRLFKNFTWRQKLHYLLLPLHYAFGLIVLLDMLIPAAALVMGQTPLYIEWHQFLWVLLPYLGLTTLIRQYAQRWLLEDHEKGFHLTGGILLFASWWVFSLGLIYTILNIKVPYIATPKNDEDRNNWSLSMPNLIVGGLNVAALVYGLSRDWSPYSWMMGSYVGLNIVLLTVVIAAAQPVLLKRVKKWLQPFSFIHLLYQPFKMLRQVILPDTYRLLRTGAPVLAILLFLTCNSFILFDYNPSKDLEVLYGPQTKDTGGFYTGMYLPTSQRNNLASVDALEKDLGTDVNIVSVHQSWKPDSLSAFPHSLFNRLAQRGAIPLITWNPLISSATERAEKTGPNILKAIAAGKYDSYIKAYAGYIQQYNYPVFIQFAPQVDNEDKSGKLHNTIHPEVFKAAYRHVVATFATSGVNNVSWVWHPAQPEDITSYYPGENYVDWIGVTCLNYGKAAKDGKWRTFEELYKPYRNEVLKLNKPVMLTEFGSTNFGGNGQEWLEYYLPLIPNYYREIRSLVFYQTNQDQNWPTTWRPESKAKGIDWTIKNSTRIARNYKRISQEAFIWQKPTLEQRALQPALLKTFRKNQKHYLTGTAGQYTLLVKGQPFYVKGVAYNPGHDWRDGNYPLTRHQLEQDFSAIKAMGANTIRRYSPSLYDDNILTIAQEKELKVLYGFWFDPKVDYYKDTLKVKKYLQKVEEMVSKFKGEPAVLGWSVGNETSSLLKKHFSQPYLSLNRLAYMHMVELMAERIHQLDPTRPVFTSLEHSRQLPGELLAFDQLVPGVDVVGINSYYIQQIGQLQKIAAQFNPHRPYLVSEFGPSGYWDPEYTSTDKNSLLIEESSSQKTALYTQEWKEFISKHQGYNIGGVAFCWRDRFEGSATWFGLTDFRGRKKPVYYALQNTWTKQVFVPQPKIAIVGPSGYLVPKTSFEFTVIGAGATYHKIEWQLYKDDYLDKMEVIEKTEQANKIMITLPEPTGEYHCNKYRLYVYVSDGKGNVLTASKSLVM
ncbi:cellulose synthase [Adhaeribacter arboris]|uniref:Cellulose synthase n=1 Tax=Adhaeribacter arboris TaxID=2072846 RepID=A0A2T2YMD2_9BACT|nr:glycosyltransferase [Adhaeribacter arboris]PSR56669.1 cellulose synthase [Adhaeribacter arboris]